MGMSGDARPTARRVVTQRDVAEAAGVDRATVSRALDATKRAMISPETAERVLSVAEQLGYRANVLARGLRTARSGVIGLEIPSNVNGSNGSLAEMISGFVSSIEDRLRLQGFTLLVTFSSSAEQAVSGPGRHGMIDGMIRLHPGGPLPAADFGPVPEVTVGFDRDPQLDIVVDEVRGIEIAVEHLHRLGHRRVAYIGEPHSFPRGERHLRAYEATLRRLGLGEPNPSLMAHYHHRHPASAPQAVESVLTRGGDPTAILFTDDKAAMGGYGVLRAQQIRIPEQVSVIGWGNSDAGLFLVPPLTTIALPLRSAAFAASDLLLARINEHAEGGADASIRRVCTPYLVQRSSTGPVTRWLTPKRRAPGQQA